MSKYAILGVALMCANACSELDNPAAKGEAKQINHGTEVYEVEFDGQKYISSRHIKELEFVRNEDTNNSRDSLDRLHHSIY